MVLMAALARAGTRAELPAGQGEHLRVDLLSSAVPAVRTPDGLRAVNKGKPGNPAQIENYLAGKFGDRLNDATQAAMAELVATYSPPTSTAAGKARGLQPNRRVHPVARV